jgi:hypothetical protein
MTDSNPQPTPTVGSLKLTAEGSAPIQDPSFYRSIVGAL